MKTLINRMVPHPLQRFLGPPDVRASLSRAQDEVLDRSAPRDRRVLQHSERGGLLTPGVHGSGVPSVQQAASVAVPRETPFKSSLLHTGVPRGVDTSRGASLVRGLLPHNIGRLGDCAFHGNAVPSTQQAALVAALREATLKMSFLHTCVPRSVVTPSEAALVRCPFPCDIGRLGDERSSPHHTGRLGSVGPHHSGAALVHSSPHSTSRPGGAVLKLASNTTNLISSVSTSARNIVIKRPYFYEQRERGVKTLHGDEDG